MTDNVTLLLVDDLGENLLAMEALLRGPAVRVLKARSGEEALELLLAHEVALALVDVQMPGMDGFELAELMRGSERTKHVPIVFVTAGAHDRKRMFQGYDSGAVDFLYKPVEPHILTNKVNVFVELFRQKKALARVSTLQSAIFNSANFSSIATDAAGVIQIFNVGAERMLGYAAADVMNKITPADISDPQELIARATALSVELGTPITPGFEALVFKASRGIEDIYELTYIRKDGSRFPAVVSVTALRDAQEIIIGYLLIGSDNTARKHAEAKLRSSETRYRRLFETAKDGVLILDGQTGQITDANPYILEVLGSTHAEVLGRELWEIGVFADATASRAAMAELQDRGYIRYDDLPLGSKTGQRRQVEVVANAYEENGHRVIQCNVRDITDRKQASQYVRSLIEASLDPLVTISAEGKITDVNEGLIKVTGMARGKLIGTDFSDYFTEPEKARGAYQQVFAKGFATDYPLTIRHQDGRLTDVLYNASVYKDMSGNVLGVFAAARDITDRKQAEESLIEAKEHAEAANKAKDNFLAALSHELRTPLTPVLMTATALASDPTLPGETREQLDMMRRNIELEAQLIDDLLDLTTISRGKLVLAPMITDLHALLGHTHEIIRSDGLGKKVQIVLKLEAGRHHALVDPTRIQQVFWNLLKNAVKFTPGGGSISVRTTNDADGRIVIVVKDNGIGISAEALPHIFNAFEQGAIAGQHRYGGLGMGLAISQAIVTAHDGAIRAESEGLNCGSDFTVELLTSDAPAASATATEPGAVPTRTLKLLIVEDHEATRQVLQRLLTIKGHQVTTAGSVQEALAIHGKERFDAVISDLGLPDGSGLDLMRELQQQRPVPGIALSGYGMEDDLLRTKEAGFFAHLVKPVNMNQLRQLINQIPPTSP